LNHSDGSGRARVIGSLGASLLVSSRRLRAWFGVSIALWGLPLVLIGAFPEQAAALALLAVIGVANALLDVSGFAAATADAAVASMLDTFRPRGIGV
jgi:hypothetical protein